MKPRLQSMRKNDEVWAVVEEVLSTGELIINFSGDLIRVQDQTSRSLRTGQRVLLQVHATDPLNFRLLVRSQKRHSRPLDVTA